MYAHRIVRFLIHFSRSVRLYLAFRCLALFVIIISCMLFQIVNNSKTLVMQIWYDAMKILYYVMKIWYDAMQIWYDVMQIWYDAMQIWYDAMQIWYDAMQ